MKSKDNKEEEILSIYSSLKDENLPLKDKRKIAREAFRDPDKLDALRQLCLDEAYMEKGNLLTGYDKHIDRVLDKETIAIIELKISGTKINLIKNTFTHRSKYIYRKHSLRGEENNTSLIILEKDNIKLTIALIGKKINLKLQFLSSEAISSKIRISDKTHLIASIQPRRNKVLLKNLKPFEQYSIKILNNELILKT